MKLSEAKLHDICQITRISNGDTWVCQMVGTTSNDEELIWSDHIGVIRNGKVEKSYPHPEPFGADGDDIDAEYQVKFICNALDLFKSAHPEVFI